MANFTCMRIVNLFGAWLIRLALILSLLRGGNETVHLSYDEVFPSLVRVGHDAG